MYLISEILKYVWYAKVKENDFPSALVFLIREVSIKSPPGLSATLRRYSKLQYNISVNIQMDMLAFYCNKITKKYNKDKPFRRPTVALNHYEQVTISSPMRPDLQILFSRFEDQVHISCIGGWHWKWWRIIINTPCPIPCKSMLLQIPKVGKLHKWN